MSKVFRLLAISVLAFGCSSPEHDPDIPWPLEEPEGIGEEFQHDAVILRASETDPFYGDWAMLFQDTPISPEQRRCNGLGIGIEMPFPYRTEAVVLLPETITRTSEKYGFEIKEGFQETWVWRSETGPFWAVTGAYTRDPFGSDQNPETLSILIYPYVADYFPPPPTNGPFRFNVEECGEMPLDQAELMVPPPQEFDLEVFSNGTRQIVHMVAQISEYQNRLFFTYRQTN